MTDTKGHLMNDFIINKSKIRNRNGVVYIDCNTSVGRLRFSTGESFAGANLADIASRIKELALSFLQGQSTKARAKIAKETRESVGVQTLRVVGAEFLRKRCSTLKPQTLLKYQSHLKALSVHFSYDVAYITQEAYDEAISDMPSVRIEFLNRVLDFARECGLLGSRILLYKAKKLPSKEAEIKPLTLQEVQAVLEKCAQLAQKNQRFLAFRNYLALAFFSGARVGEMLALTREDVDFDNEKITISKSKLRGTNIIGSTKTNKTRYIDMLPLAKTALESQLALRQAQIQAAKQKLEKKLAQSSRIRTKRAEKALQNAQRVFDFSEIELSSMWREVLGACGLESRVLYQTRHSFATIMLTHDEEPLWISAMLGHSSLHTTFTHYIKYIPTKKKRAAFVGFTL